jgi:salicylate hydroxylase
MHVLIAGGGLGGLCLAQGLRKAGVSFDVYERHPEAERKIGYRLHMNATGGEALRACLPDDLFELYLETSRTTPPREVAVVITPNCDEITSMPHMGPPNEGERPHTAVNRQTLRQIMLGRIGDNVHAGRAAIGFDQDGDGVTVHLDDGTTARGDVLVGADGIASAVRAKLLPDVPIIPAPVEGIREFARTPLPPEVVAELPEILMSGFVIASDGAGRSMAIGAFTPRRPVAEAAADIAPDVHVDPVEPYMMIAGDLSTPLSDAWHPALRGLVERLDPGTLFENSFRRLDPTPAWPSSRVTLLGDAIHAMLPTRGQGGNMALRDAAALARALIDEGVDGIAGYEQEMRDVVYPIMQVSADHSSIGGGGLRAGAR